MRLLGPLARLPLRDQAPTTPVEVRYRSRVLRYADGNIFAALELALERPARPSSLPRMPLRSLLAGVVRESRSGRFGLT
jgi:hypothetical protein